MDRMKSMSFTYSWLLLFCEEKAVEKSEEWDESWLETEQLFLPHDDPSRVLWLLLLDIIILEMENSAGVSFFFFAEFATTIPFGVSLLLWVLSSLTGLIESFIMSLWPPSDLLVLIE